MNRCRFLAVFLLVLLTSSVVFAQRDTGAIEGTVKDNEDRPIPGVTVTALSSSLIGGSRSANTDQDGFYRFPVLAPGNYEVKAELNGFQTVVRKDITLSIASTLAANFNLELSNVSETIDVTDHPPLIDATTTSVANTVPPEIISNLPMRADIQSLIALTPGVSDDLVSYGANHSRSTRSKTVENYATRVDSVFGSPTFGKPFRYNDPRQIRLGVRYTF